MRVMVARIAAIGDCIQISPLCRYLKEQGHEVYVLTSEWGVQILKNNPFIDKLILYVHDTVPCEELYDYFNKVAKENKCDKVINLNECVEVKYLFHAADPVYNYTKQERFLRGNKNHYDAVFEAAGFPEVTGKRPEMFFDEKEEEASARFRKDFIGKFLIVWCLAGSARHKAYPFTRVVMEKLLLKYPDIVIITVGDDWCKNFEEGLEHERIIHKSGKWNIRETAIACKYASLVIAPETGVAHLAGCFDTPKIVFLTHTTKECLSKYFKNDYSIEAKVDCAPCFRLIDDCDVQCPVEPLSRAPWCVAFGFPPEEFINQVEKVYLR
ncbi:MAG TPA: glycosyltransferase family 9 protein [Candidatus Cloacimonas sp.]|nr:glycosyltransferase family 9 protein [Candidatus Cloacimonas sp.]